MRTLTILMSLFFFFSCKDAKTKMAEKQVDTVLKDWTKGEGDKITFYFPPNCKLKTEQLSSIIRQYRIISSGSNSYNGWMEIYEINNDHNYSFSEFLFSAQEFYQQYIGSKGDPRIYNNVKADFKGLEAQRIEIKVKVGNEDILTTCLMINGKSHFYLINYTKSNDENENELIKTVLNSVIIYE